MNHFYEVIVSNIGKVHEGDDELKAQLEYCAWVGKSKADVGRAGGESVSLWKDNEPIAEYEGAVNDGSDLS